MRALLFICILGFHAVASAQTTLPAAPMSTTSPSGASTATLDGRYLKLDLSNAPVTGQSWGQTNSAAGSDVNFSITNSSGAASSSASLFLVGVGANEYGWMRYADVANQFSLNTSSAVTGGMVFGHNGTSSDMIFNVASREMLRLGNTALGASVFNEGSADIDFRVETDTNTHGLFVDAGNNCVGIFQSSCSGAGSGGLLTGNVYIGGVLNPNADVTRDIGSSAATWRDLYISHVQADGSSPTISGVSSCTGATIAGFDTAGYVTATCTAGQNVTVVFARGFATGGATAEANCVVVPRNANAATGITYIGTSSATSFQFISVAGTGGGSGIWNYHCVGNN